MVVSIRNFQLLQEDSLHFPGKRLSLCYFTMTGIRLVDQRLTTYIGPFHNADVSPSRQCFSILTQGMWYFFEIGRELGKGKTSFTDDQMKPREADLRLKFILGGRIAIFQGCEDFWDVLTVIRRR